MQATARKDEINEAQATAAVNEEASDTVMPLSSSNLLAQNKILSNSNTVALLNSSISTIASVLSQTHSVRSRTGTFVVPKLKSKSK